MRIEFNNWDIIKLDKALGITKDSHEYLLENDEVIVNRLALLKFINQCKISQAEIKHARIIANGFVNSLLLKYDSIYSKVKISDYELGKSNYSQYLYTWNALVLVIDRFWEKTKLECYNQTQIEVIEKNRKKFKQYLHVAAFQN